MGSRFLILPSGPNHSRLYHREYSAGRHRGTQVADTFSLADTFKYALSQIAYVFGINGTGTSQWLPMGAESLAIKGLVLLADACIAVIVLAAFLVKLVREKLKENSCSDAEEQHSVFILFTGLCITSSSVTIRVEMRCVCISLVSAFIPGLICTGNDRGSKRSYLKRL